MKPNTQRTRRLILPALLVVALLGSLIAPTSQAARMTPGAAAAMAGGTVVGWGSNGNHQVDIPAEAQSGVTAIAAGFFHSLALKPPNAAPVAVSKNVTVSAGASCTASASIDNGSFDPDSGDSITVTQSPAGPYALGTTSVTLTVTDNHGASSSCTATVTVGDSTRPIINAPANLNLATGAGAISCGVVISEATLGTATATDNCSTNLPVTRMNVPPGNLFPVGTTTIIYTATDAAGNSQTATQNVTVTDNAPPVLICPTPIAVDGSNVLGGATVTFSVTAADNCGGAPNLTYSKAPGSLFPFGVTPVTATANDGRGNISQCSFTVTVRTPQQQTTLLKTQVQVLVTAGALTPAQGAGLTDKLNETITKLNQGQKGAACNQLSSFIAQVNALIGGNALTSAQGQALISAANNVKVSLGC